jgi:hypothetical protein
MGASQDRGHAGEQSMGFYWGERGYFLIEGPSGAGGHAANAAGFDGVAYNPTTGHMVIYDNKAFARSGNVYDASAITTNFAKNLDTLIGRVQGMSDMPRQQDIVSDLSNARAALTTPTAWPKNVQVAVSNASGQSTGVGGKLANGNISFINYNAAPPVRPAAPPSAPTSASTGSPWAGPGGTPGFDTSRVQGVASGLKLFWRWAEGLSMMSSAREALAEFYSREDEIIDLQRQNPALPVWVIFTFTYDLGQGEQPKIYRYLGMELVSNGTCPMSLGAPRDTHYQISIPALKASAPQPFSSQPAGPAWRSAYMQISGALQGDPFGWRAENPERAHRLLNACPMYDMLLVVQELKKADWKLFRLLENTVWNNYGVYNARNAAAILAVRMADNSGGDKLSDYKASCKEFGLLPQDQQQDIENFLSGKLSDDSGSKKKASGVPEWLSGWWTVWDGGYYYYYFTDQFTVSYVKTKPSGSTAAAPKAPHNKGKFIRVEHGIKIFWNPVDGSSTEETFTQRDWKSETEMNGVSNKYSPLFARRMP